MPQAHINKCMTCIQHDRMLSIEVNFHKASESIRRRNENMMPNKYFKLKNAAALPGRLVDKILSFGTNGFPSMKYWIGRSALSSSTKSVMLPSTEQ